jgi:DNA-directed RNA polymerase specialized sigma24 family protein
VGVEQRQAPPAPELTLRAAALALAGPSPQDGAGRRIRRAADASLSRAGVRPADLDDVRQEVAIALLRDRGGDDACPLDRLCARVSVIARNKAVDHHRRQVRALPAGGVDELHEPAAPAPTGLGAGLTPAEAAAHRKGVRLVLGRLLAALPERERRAVLVHAAGGGHADAGLSRSTYHRLLARSHARLAAGLQGKLAGILGIPTALARIAARSVADPVAQLAAAGGGAAVVTTAVLVLATGPGPHHPPPPARGGPAIVIPRPVTRPAPRPQAARHVPVTRPRPRPRPAPRPTAPTPRRVAIAPVATRVTPRRASVRSALCAFDRASYYCRRR